MFCGLLFPVVIASMERDPAILMIPWIMHQADIRKLIYFYYILLKLVCVTVA